MKSMFKDHDVLVTTIHRYSVYEIRINEFGKRVVDFYADGNLRFSLMAEPDGYSRFFPVDVSSTICVSTSTSSLRKGLALL